MKKIIKFIFVFSVGLQFQTLASELPHEHGFLTGSEIAKLPTAKQIQYLRALRDLLVSAEQVQNSFANPGDKSASIKFLELYQTALQQAFANSNNDCILAGDSGLMKKGLCTFLSADDRTKRSCDSGKGILCNKSLYLTNEGEPICAPFTTVQERGSATAYCNENGTIENLLKDLQKRSKDAEGMYSILNGIQEVARSVGLACSENGVIKSTLRGDRLKTCEKFNERLEAIQKESCDPEGENSSPNLKDFCTKKLAAKPQVQVQPPAKPNPPPKPTLDQLCQAFSSKMEQAKKDSDQLCLNAGYKPTESVAWYKKPFVGTLQTCYYSLQKCFEKTPLRSTIATTMPATTAPPTNPCLLNSAELKTFPIYSTNSIDELLKVGQKYEISCPQFKADISKALKEYKTAFSAAAIHDSTEKEGSHKCSTSDCLSRLYEFETDLGWAFKGLESTIEGATRCGKNSSGPVVSNDDLSTLRNLNQKLHDQWMDQVKVEGPKDETGVGSVYPSYKSIRQNLTEFYRGSSSDTPNYDNCCKSGSINDSVWCKGRKAGDPNELLGDPILSPSEEKSAAATDTTPKRRTGGRGGTAQ
jgi:hypothetical protein